MKLYPKIGLFLYFVLGYIVACNFQLMAERVHVLGSQVVSIQADEFSIRLREWKRQHAVVYECADEMNQTFGFLLLLHVTGTFVGVVAMSFFLTALTNLLLISFTVLRVLAFVFDLWLICHISDSLINQVFLTGGSQIKNSSYTLKSLRKIPS